MSVAVTRTCAHVTSTHVVGPLPPHSGNPAAGSSLQRCLVTVITGGGGGGVVVHPFLLTGPRDGSLSTSHRSSPSVASQPMSTQSLATVCTSVPGAATHWLRRSLTNCTAPAEPLVSTVATQRTWLPFCSACRSRTCSGRSGPKVCTSLGSDWVHR